MKKTKSAEPPTRAAILKGINYQPLKPMKGVPERVRAADDRDLKNYVVAWTQGMAAHIAKVDAAAKERKRAQRKRVKASR